MKVGLSKDGLNYPLIINGLPKAILPLHFLSFYGQCCSTIKCFHFKTSVSPNPLLH